MQTLTMYEVGNVYGAGVWDDIAGGLEIAGGALMVAVAGASAFITGGLDAPVAIATGGAGLSSIGIGITTIEG